MNLNSDGGRTLYYHTDHLGTTRLMSDASGYAASGWYDTSATNVTPSVFTAFGEPIFGPLDGESNRYGYVGAHGYQAHDQSHMRFLHVGHRYYDPGSGRFLQRDPIGIDGGLNVFAYTANNPTAKVDPNGDFFIIIVAVIFVLVVEEVAEAPGPDDLQSDFHYRQRRQDRENLSDVRMISSGAAQLGRRAASGFMRCIHRMRSPNPRPFVSPFGPPVKGPFIGGGTRY